MGADVSSKAGSLRCADHPDAGSRLRHVPGEPAPRYAPVTRAPHGVLPGAGAQPDVGHVVGSRVAVSTDRAAAGHPNPLQYLQPRVLRSRLLAARRPARHDGSDQQLHQLRSLLLDESTVP